jgi:hypothetical protein
MMLAIHTNKYIYYKCDKNLTVKLTRNEQKNMNDTKYA